MNKEKKIVLRAIKMKQFSHDLILAIMTKEDLLQLDNANCLRVDKYQTEDEDSYQRVEDPKRIQELSDYLIDFQKDRLVTPLLPASIVINVQDADDVSFDDENNALTIKKGAKLYIIDGQHRKDGILKAIKEQDNIDIEIPVTFILGMEKFKEAAQFLILNVKQKPVRTDLALTVLYNLGKAKTIDFVKSLKQVLKVGAWKLEATAIAIEINSNPVSPWNKMIIGPNQDAASLKSMGIKWAPIKQAAFVDTLRYFCSLNLPMLDLNSKAKYLIRLWNTLKIANKNAFNPDVGKNYMLLRGLCVGPMHIFASLLYVLENSKYQDLDASLKIFTSKYKEKFWDKNNSKGIKTWGSSQKEYTSNAKKMAENTFPDLYNYWDEKPLIEYYDNDIIDDKEQDKIRDLFDPFNLRPFDKDLIENEIKSNKHGCYVLLSKTESGLKVYCGQSEDIKARIGSHPRKYKLFNSIDIDKERLNAIESVLYHLIKSECRINDTHPPNCPICKS